MTERELKSGQDFYFENDDLKFGSITWNETFKNFCIEFNGSWIMTTESYNSAKKRLWELFDEFDCSFI